jgi:hypothetical protein
MRWLQHQQPAAEHAAIIGCFEANFSFAYQVSPGSEENASAKRASSLPSSPCCRHGLL